MHFRENISPRLLFSAKLSRAFSGGEMTRSSDQQLPCQQSLWSIDSVFSMSSSRAHVLSGAGFLRRQDVTR